eukprot:3432893-Pleurochrysis_carterae.AAC.2
MPGGGMPRGGMPGGAMPCCCIPWCGGPFGRWPPCCMGGSDDTDAHARRSVSALPGRKQQSRGDTGGSRHVPRVVATYVARRHSTLATHARLVCLSARATECTAHARTHDAAATLRCAAAARTVVGTAYRSATLLPADPNLVAGAIARPLDSGFSSVAACD